MLSPSELEGEVDHSFFDSDGDDGSLGRDRERIDNPPAQAKQNEKTKDVVSPRTQRQQVNKSRGRVERKEDRYKLKEEQRGMASNSRTSERDDNVHLKKPNRTSADALSTDEEELPSSAKPSKLRKKKSKKVPKDQPTEYPHSTSPETSMEADSESSSLCSGEKKATEDVAADLSAVSCSGESVTDVSPLSTPDLNRRDAQEESTNKQQEQEEHEDEDGQEEEQEEEQVQEQEEEDGEQEEDEDKEREEEMRVPSSGLSNTHSDKNSDECSLSSESQFEEQIIFYHTGPKSRKNYTFNNDQVRRIDKENQRLLRALSCFSAGPRPASAQGKKVLKKSQSAITHTSSSKINRQREQKRIERENLAMLKRLESVRPSLGMRRTDQLADYRRQVEYLEPPSLSICVSASKKDKSAKKTPERPRSASFTNHSPRAGSATSASSNSPVRRSKPQSAGPPAWC